MSKSNKIVISPLEEKDRLIRDYFKNPLNPCQYISY